MRAILEQDFLGYAVQRRYFVMRALVVALPLAVLLLITGGGGRNAEPDAIGRLVFGASFVALLIVVLFVAPAISAHVLGEERRNNRLDVLRTTPLSAFSIVCGRWLSRFLLVSTAIVAGLALPALSLLYGGVTPVDLLCAALVLFASAMVGTSTAMLLGARGQPASAALRQAYLLTVAHALLPLMLQLGIAWAGSPTPLVRVAWSISPVAVGMALALPPLRRPFQMSIGQIVALFVTFSFAVTLACLVASAWQLVRQKGAEADGGGSSAVPIDGAAGSRRAAGRFSRNLALLWRDPAVWLERYRSQPGAGRIRRMLALCGLLGFEMWFVLALRESGLGPDAAGMHLFAVLLFVFLAFLAVAGEGATSLLRDGEANTREVLWSTPLCSGQLARAKIVGALRAGRAWWCLALAHAALGVVCGGLALLELLLFAMVSAVLLHTLAGFSVRAGMTARSSARASARVMGSVVFVLLLLPMIAGLLGLALRDVSALYILIGAHPLWISAVALRVGHNPVDGDLGWIVAMLYFCGYVVLGVVLRRSLVPETYAALRDDGPVS